MTSVPTAWLPFMCPTRHIDGGCDDEGRTVQVMVATIVGSFFFIFMILLVKTPAHSPSEIPMLNCAIIAGALYAFFGMFKLLGGGLNPAAGLAVIWVFKS